MIDERLKNIQKYFISLQKFDGRWCVCVQFNEKWTAYNRDDNKITVTKDDKERNVWWYYASNRNIEVGSIFELIEETINVNIEAIQKAELFKLKAEELRKIFADNKITLMQLTNLKFTFDKDENGDTPTVKATRKPRVRKPIPQPSVDNAEQGETEAESNEVEYDNQENIPYNVESVAKSTDESFVGEPIHPSELSKEDINNLIG